VLAIVVMTAIAQVSGRSILRTRVVGRVDAPAWASQMATAIAPGDTIVAVNGTRVATWNDIGDALVTSPETTVTITTNRGSVSVAAGPAAGERRGDLLDALLPWYPPVAGQVIAGKPAAKAGLQTGDTLVSIDSTPIRNFGDLIGVVSPAAGKPLLFTIRRGAETKQMTIVPDSQPAESTDSVKHYVGKVGIGQADIAVHEAIGFPEAVSAGWGMTWGNVALVGSFLKHLASGQASMRDMGGPIAITQASVEAARGGAIRLFGLLAFLSVNLAVMNLLPIPILDGGQIVMNVAESIKGRPFSLRTKENFARVGLLAIALLFVVVMFNDVRRIAGTAMGFLSRVF
jgi:regulator of sigma E protease